jgi:hypothetical protein
MEDDLDWVGVLGCVQTLLQATPLDETSAVSTRVAFAIPLVVPPSHDGILFAVGGCSDLGHLLSQNSRRVTSGQPHSARCGWTDFFCLQTRLDGAALVPVTTPRAPLQVMCGGGVLYLSLICPAVELFAVRLYPSVDAV